jgi:hypothetical protein
LQDSGLTQTLLSRVVSNVSSDFALLFFLPGTEKPTTNNTGKDRDGG